MPPPGPIKKGSQFLLLGFLEITKSCAYFWYKISFRLYNAKLHPKNSLQATMLLFLYNISYGISSWIQYFLPSQTKCGWSLCLLLQSEEKKLQNMTTIQEEGGCQSWLMGAHKDLCICASHFLSLGFITWFQKTIPRDHDTNLPPTNSQFQ